MMMNESYCTESNVAYRLHVKFISSQPGLSVSIYKEESPFDSITSLSELPGYSVRFVGGAGVVAEQ
jgi:hypothetical protein